jgi:hypothetical protein
LITKDNPNKKNKILDFVGECKDGGAPHQLKIENTLFESRYNFWEEYAEMYCGFLSVPEKARNKIKSIFCDSQAQAVYSIEFNNDVVDEMDVMVLSKMFEEGLIKNLNGLGGHNGIYTKDFDLDLSPYWKE